MTTADAPLASSDARSLRHTWALSDDDFDGLLDTAQRLWGLAGRAPVLAGVRAARRRR